MFGHENNKQDDTMSAPMTPSSTNDTPSSSSMSEPAITTSHDANTVTPTDSTSATTPASEDLLDIKQQALQQLTPLVGHLDQTPEEKFRTTMMMIQGSDNQALIKDAYEAAQAITDEKARAQALLDIVNEINYFTQHNTSSPAS